MIKLFLSNWKGKKKELKSIKKVATAESSNYSWEDREEAEMIKT